MELRDIRVFVCVPGVGKSYLVKKDDRFVDLDDLKARYKYAMEDVSEAQMEFLKGNRGKSVRDDSTEYMKKITLDYLNNTNKILLFAPNPLMVDMIFKQNIPYCLVYHSKSCVEEIRQRMRKRGNQENFINSMLDPIDEFYKASVEDKRPAFKIELFEGEFLSDKLLEIFKWFIFWLCVIIEKGVFMKVFKKLFSFALMLIFGFSLTACNKKQPPNNPADGNPPEEKQLSTSEILKFAFDSFDEDSKKEIDGKNCYSEKQGDTYLYSSYDEYAFSSFKLLEELSKIQNLQENVWMDSNEDVSILSGANKLSKFCVSSEIFEQFTEISVHMKFEVEGFAGPVDSKTFEMVCFTVKYYPITKTIYACAMIEKSRNNVAINENDSTAEYFVVEYNAGNIVAMDFDRVLEIDDVEDIEQINYNCIKNFEYLKFDCKTNNEVVFIDSFQNQLLLGYSYEQIRSIIFDRINEFVLLEQAFDGVSGVTERLHGDLSQIYQIVNQIGA